MTIGGIQINFSISSVIRRATSRIGAHYRALRTAKTLADRVRVARRILRDIDRAHDTLNAIRDAVDLLTFDPSDLAMMYREMGFLRSMTKYPARGMYVGRDFSLPRRVYAKLRRLRSNLGRSKFVNEMIGEAGSALVAYSLGFQTTGLTSFYRGIDSVMYHSGLGVYMIIEAKGGPSSSLGNTADGRQMSGRWITRRLDKLIRKNRSLGGTKKAEADRLQAARNRGDLMLAMVTKVDLSNRRHQLRVAVQTYDPSGPAPNSIRTWRGLQ